LICLIRGRRGIHWQTKAEGRYAGESICGHYAGKARDFKLSALAGSP